MKGKDAAKMIGKVLQDGLETSLPEAVASSGINELLLQQIKSAALSVDKLYDCLTMISGELRAKSDDDAPGDYDSTIFQKLGAMGELLQKISDLTSEIYKKL